jgi:hypothetical protein
LPSPAKAIERWDSDIQYEVHSLCRDPNRQCIQRIVLAAFRLETIAEPEEVFLVNTVQHRQSRLLDDLVFQCSDGERTLFALGIITRATVAPDTLLDEFDRADPSAWSQHRVRILPMPSHLHRATHLFSASDTIPGAGEHPHGGAAP